MSYILKEMGTREVYDYEQQKWIPYVSDPDKWYQHLLDMRDGLVEPDYLGRFIVGSGEKHRRHKEMEAKQIENQRPVAQVSYRFLALGCFPANLVSDEKEQKTEDRDGQFVY